jgi:hypothetical protein
VFRYLGDEISAQGVPFDDMERWIDLVAGFLQSLPPPPQTTGEYMLYYTESDFACTWPVILFFVSFRSLF